MFSNTLWAKESLLKRNSRTGIWTDKKYQHSYYPGGSQQLQRSIHASLLSLLGWGDSLVDIMFAVPQRDWVSAVQNAGIVMSFRIIYWFDIDRRTFIQYFVHLSALIIVKLNDRIVVGYRIITAAVCTPNHKRIRLFGGWFQDKKAVIADQTANAKGFWIQIQPIMCKSKPKEHLYCTLRQAYWHCYSVSTIFSPIFLFPFPQLLGGGAAGRRKRRSSNLCSLAHIQVISVISKHLFAILKSFPLRFLRSESFLRFCIAHSKVVV